MLDKAKNIVKSVDDYYGSGKVEEALQELLKIVETQERALDIYKRERERFLHSNPEITGMYFLTGGSGQLDTNMLPDIVRICPAYGCAWEQVYKKTNDTISYEGS